MTEPVFGLTSDAAKVLQEMADKHRQRLPDVGRRTRRIGIRGGDVSVIGPCASYTPDEADPDTDFETAYPGGCDGPDVLGMNLLNITTGVTTVYRMEVVSTGPLVLETVETFSLTCGGVSITCYGRVTVNDLSRSIETYSGGWTFTGVVGSIVKDSDDSIIQQYRNALYSYNPMAGGNLQLGPEATSCNCGTLPYDLCLSIPTA